MPLHFSVLFTFWKPCRVPAVLVGQLPKQVIHLYPSQRGQSGVVNLVHFHPRDPFQGYHVQTVGSMYGVRRHSRSGEGGIVEVGIHVGIGGEGCHVSIRRWAGNSDSFCVRLSTISSFFVWLTWNMAHENC